MKKKRNRQYLNHGGMPKFLLKMKLLTFFIFVSIASVTANSYSQQTKFNMSLENVTVRQVFQEIEDNSEFILLYSEKSVDVNRKVSVSVNNQTVEKILDQVFSGTKNYYEINDRQIAVMENENSEVPANLKRKTEEQQPQKKEVSGTVTDNKGKPIPGVSAFVKGTTIGIVTDSGGVFRLEVPVTAKTLVFSFIGMKTQEIALADKTIFTVVMEEETVGLEEVVAIGYGTQIRKNLSSSVTKVDAENLINPSTTSFEATLEGRAAGVQVVSGSALSGSAVRIRIRGVSSASASSDPLYVIDGIPIESGEISTNQPGLVIKEGNLQTATQTNVLASLNPADIESLEILKDAASAAIYGSRGANGVVLITTKKGRVGKTQVKASASFGLSDATHRIKLLNSEQYIGLAQEAWVNSGKNITDFWDKSGVLVDGLTKEQALKTNTDWIDETLQIGNTQDYNISVTGGNEKTIFFMSANLKDEKSILRGNKYLKFGTRLNIEHQLSNRFRVGSNIMISHIDNQPVVTSWSGGSGKANFMLPIWPIYKPDGTYFNLSPDNPVAGVNLREINLASNQFLCNWFLKANIVKGLTFRTEFGANLLFNDDFHYLDGRITAHGRTISATVIGNRISWNLKNILTKVSHIYKAT